MENSNLYEIIKYNAEGACLDFKKTQYELGKNSKKMNC